MTESPVERDLKKARLFLDKQRTRDRIRKFCTFGLWNNTEGVKKAETLFECCQESLAEYNKLICRAATLDSDRDGSISFEGVRYSTGNCVDLPSYVSGGYGVDWEVLRESILSRDNHCCKEADGRCDGPLDVHHILPLSKRGTNNPDNLITLCRYHHGNKHPHMRRK
jgi:hypothetical protein